MNRVIRFLFMLIVVPLDYIGWNLIFGHTHGKITLKKAITDNWKVRGKAYERAKNR